MTPCSPRARLLLGLGLLALLALAVHGPSLGHGLINFDDDVYITNNPLVQNGLSLQGAAAAFRFHPKTYWHPLTWLSLMADVSLFGPGPFGHHLTNVLLHTLVCLLAFGFFLGATGRFWPSLLTAALLAAHPAHVESVSWATERKDVLSAVFFFAALLAYRRYALRPGPGRYAVLALCLGLGLMAKPMLVTLPCLLLVLDVWPLHRLRWPPGRLAWPVPAGPALARGSGDAWGLVLEKLPLLALGLASIALAWASHPPPEAPGPGPGALSLAANALASFPRYLGMLLWPVDLIPLHRYPVKPPLALAGLGLGLVAAALVLGVRQRRERPWLLAGWLWFAGTLVPVLKVYDMGLWYAVAERFLYIPAVGLYAALAFTLDGPASAGPDARSGSPGPLVRTRARTRTVVLGCVLLVAALGWLGHRQTLVWRDSRTLFAHTLRVDPDNWLAAANLGADLAAQGDPGQLPRARSLLEQAVARNPNLPDAWSSLGVVLLRQGRPTEALDAFRKASGRSPSLAPARQGAGAALLALNRPVEALEELEKAQALRPDHGQTLLQLGAALLALDRPGEALPVLERAAALLPGDAAARQFLREARRRAGSARP